MPNQNAVDAATLLHCSLLQVDLSTGTYAPALADSLPRMQLLGDSLTHLRYQLRHAAAWDNGRPVLATDVAFTLKLIFCPGLPNEKARTQLGFIRDIKLDPTNPRHFTLVCRGQAPEFGFESGEFPILAEDALDSKHSLRQFSLASVATANTAEPTLAALAARYQQADLEDHSGRLPGCGPYKLAAWKKNQYLTFERKTHWWADSLRPAPLVLQAKPTKLHFSIIKDDATATLALRRHELDVLPQASARDFKRLQALAATQQRFAFYTTTSYEVVTAGFNTRRPLLRDSLTRQALSRLFDPARLLQATQLGQGQRTVGLVHPNDHRYYASNLPLLAYDLPQAQVLLQRAGWQHRPTGWTRPAAKGQSEHLALALRYRAEDPVFQTIALQFKAAATQLNIPVELRPTESSLLTTALREGDFDMYVRIQKGNPFAFNYASMLHSRNVQEGNFSKFGTPATDRLIEAVATAETPAQKRQLLQRFQVMLQQQAPLVPLFFLPYRLVTDRRLQNVYPSAIKPGYSAPTMTWTDAAPVLAQQ
ncbi:ABC transporter substrate-binding protein [Hymenobacter sp. BT559]|uniref:ABC transporter substrate-binding protein n=1 Tax=Hymenobacter sp. BT559 TaxID=2795729 RepID=UPI0018EC4460|nr:ABC transporter substrate-binding protein [Hymenobacter sp. BT559]MBJ6143355.1 ABC transporter substrate-binding protein [Hymenobacter sp. BT559]